MSTQKNQPKQKKGTFENEETPRKRFYISDLDGTLLRNDATISRQSCGILNKLMENGLLFTVASARSVYTIREVTKDLNLTLPVIELNGSFVSDLQSGRHLVINEIDSSLPPRIHEIVKEHGLAPIVATFNGHGDRLYFDSPLNGGMELVIENRKRAKDPRLEQKDDLKESFREQVVCFTVIGYENQLSRINEALQKIYSTSLITHLFRDIYTEFHWLTIQNRNASKNIAIQTILEKKGLGHCELVVFGDNDNDLSMFRMADRAIAVQNATEALKKRATQIIGSNQDESVVKYLQLDQ